MGYEPGPDVTRDASDVVHDATHDASDAVRDVSGVNPARTVLRPAVNVVQTPAHGALPPSPDPPIPRAQRIPSAACLHRPSAVLAAWGAAPSWQCGVGAAAPSWQRGA